MGTRYSSNEFRKRILAKLSHNFGVNPTEATDEHYYKAIVLVVNDMLTQERTRFLQEAENKKVKQVYYLCMEFLMGRSLKNNLYNLGLEEIARSSLKNLGVKLESIYEQEPDAGLGNGGLGRLAACFLDSLASEGYPAMGYCLRYEYGIFCQKLVDGWQTELPDFWLPGGEVWLQPHPEKKIKVLFNGEIEESWDGNYHHVTQKNATKVYAVPYDLLVAGKKGRGVSKLRLWAAKSADFNMELFNSGNYARAMEQNAMAEVITKVLYPEDNHAEGKSLRLSQQYFLVSATVQDIIRRHLRNHGTLDNLVQHAVIHLNDTHPVLAIPELMRLMLDDCGYSWDSAWDIASKVFAYTNHTVMAEALENWSQEMFRMRLPRIYQIIEEINRRFCAQMHDLGVDGYQVGRMAILNDGMVKMANLAVATCPSVNGVSKLHSNILKEHVFNDFYTVMPEKFKNVTNGIAYRRWLVQSNPALATMISELIGNSYLDDASELEKLLAYKDDSEVLKRLAAVKKGNKERLANDLKLRHSILVDPTSIFDIQVKRLHEYKRQHLNALHILSKYLYLKENPNAPYTPKTYIFGAKAAPGYYFAKQMIRLIVKLGEMIDKDQTVRDKLKVVFVEDYRVTLAERLMPAAEISEQISLAGTEASGTGNMKLMINGAITLGTLDGANVEIKEAVGPDNMILFGMTAEEVEALKRTGYHPMEHYNNNPSIKASIDLLYAGIEGVKFDDIARSLTTLDPYMVLADFADYEKAQKIASELYNDAQHFNRMSLTNIAKAGRFSSDRAIREYAKNIWNIKPVK